MDAAFCLFAKTFCFSGVFGVYFAGVATADFTSTAFIIAGVLAPFW